MKGMGAVHYSSTLTGHTTCKSPAAWLVFNKWYQLSHASNRKKCKGEITVLFFHPFPLGGTSYFICLINFWKPPFLKNSRLSVLLKPLVVKTEITGCLTLLSSLTQKWDALILSPSGFPNSLSDKTIAVTWVTWQLFKWLLKHAASMFRPLQWLFQN